MTGGGITIMQGGSLDRLRELPADSVQCCVTSPPYWGLRDYGVAGQIGLEPTIEEYVASMVEVFAQVWRVLRPDGTLWLNLGDTYAASRSYQVVDNKYKDVGNKIGHKVPEGLKQKDLCGIPWRVALALQADGWWLRRDIIWSKPNPMPESCTDRPTTAHEYIFLLTKSAHYFYDSESVKEECQSGPSDIRKMQESKERIGGYYKDNDDLMVKASKHTNIGRKRSVGSPNGRNCRSVWNIATAPFPGAHFATFPQKLVQRCVAAGSKEGDMILDPFSGAGTTGLVAAKMGRCAVLIELNPEYCEMAGRRIKNELGLLAEVVNQ